MLGRLSDDPHGRGRPPQRSPTETTPTRLASPPASTTTAARRSPTRPATTRPATRSPPTPGIRSTVFKADRRREAATRDGGEGPPTGPTPSATSPPSDRPPPLRPGGEQGQGARRQRRLAPQDQLPNSRWPIKFGNWGIRDATGESLYALSLAGLPADHPAVRKGVVALLTRASRSAAGSTQIPYEHSRRPRDAMVADGLSRLLSQPRYVGLGQPDRPPADPRLRTDSESLLIADLERVWNAPGPGLEAEILKALDHPSPLSVGGVLGTSRSRHEGVDRGDHGRGRGRIEGRPPRPTPPASSATASGPRSMGRTRPGRVVFEKAMLGALVSDDDRTAAAPGSSPRTSATGARYRHRLRPPSGGWMIRSSGCRRSRALAVPGTGPAGAAGPRPGGQRSI